MASNPASPRESSGSLQQAPVEIPCAFCRGRGLDPYQIMSERSRCCVCGGSGKVVVTEPFDVCAHCQGTGSVKTLTCTACKGKGVLSRSRAESDSQTCPECGGTGDDNSAPAMACLRCRGRGRVPLERRGS